MASAPTEQGSASGAERVIPCENGKPQMVEAVTFAVNQVAKGTESLPCVGALDFFSRRLDQDIGADQESSRERCEIH